MGAGPAKWRRRPYPANLSEAGETRHFAAHVGITSGDFFSRSRAAVLDLFKSPAHNLSMKSNSIRTSIDLPRDLHRRVHEAAARKGCSARKLILAGIERAVEEAKVSRPIRRLSLDQPLIRPAGRRIRITNEEAYELIELP
jgi:hypothetical protein